MTVTNSEIGAYVDSLADVGTPASGDELLIYDVSATTTKKVLASALGGTVADILDLPTAETDTALVLAPDGVGGVEFRAETGGGGGSLTSSSQTLGADAAIAIGSWSDILSMSLAAGTWIVWVSALVHNDGSGSCGVAGRIWDGTTIYGSGDSVISGTDVRQTLPIVSEPIVLGSTTTIKLSCQAIVNTAHALAAATSASSAKATRMLALKIA